MSTRFQPLREAFSISCEWPAVFALGRGYNWVDFTFIHLACEYDKVGAQFEIEAGLVGFRLRICIPAGRTEQNDELRRRVEAVRNGSAATVPLAEIQARLEAEHNVKDIFVIAEGIANEKKEG